MFILLCRVRGSTALVVSEALTLIDEAEHFQVETSCALIR